MKDTKKESTLKLEKKKITNESVKTLTDEELDKVAGGILSPEEIEKYFSNPNNSLIFDDCPPECTWGNNGCDCEDW